jgi:hypothetical protein
VVVVVVDVLEDEDVLLLVDVVVELVDELVVVLEVELEVVVTD